MSEKPILDRLRDREDGRLTSAERAELERELAADPALLALAEDYRLVHRLTAAELVHAPVSRTRFETIAARLPQDRGRRAAAAAAALVLAAGAGFLAGRRGGGDDRPLPLSVIELETPRSAVVLPAELPARWADYDPRGAGGVRFLANLDEAELLARAAQRPLLVYGSYPGCPLCVALDERVFSDPDVIELAGRTVPVRVNLAELSEDEQRSFTARGYPFLEMWRDDGRTTHSLARNPDPGIFVESLHDGLEKSDAVGEQPPWEELRRSVKAFVAARGAELEGRLAEAERAFRALSDDPRVPQLIAAHAAAGVGRLTEAARTLLLEARSAAASDPAEAARLLEHALARFAGTSFEADLRAALLRLLRDGRFPRLVEADRSA